MRPEAASVRTITETVAHAIRGAQADLVGYVRDTGARDEALMQAHAYLARALHALVPQSRLSSRQRAADLPTIKSGSEGPHDLTRIRGIDAKAVDRLHALGISRFEQIAAWEPADVRTIGQALDLGRGFQNNGVIDQAKMLLAPAEMSDLIHEDAVSGWRPHAAQHGLKLAAVEPEPLTEAQLASVHAALRRGPGRAELRNIAAIVPMIARPIPVPVETIEMDDVAPWRPSPLLETATPVAADTPIGDASKEPPAFATDLEAPLRAEAHPLPVDVRPADPEPPAEKPTHILTLDRIAALDAEITALGSRPEISSRAEPNGVKDGGLDLLAVTPALVVKTPSPSVSVPRMRLRPVSSEEADVTIKVRSGEGPSLLQPMSELLLRPKRKLVLTEPMPDAPTDVSEAAVVIVKRRARERAAPDLEFYKQGGPSGQDGTTASSHHVTGSGGRVESELAS